MSDKKQKNNKKKLDKALPKQTFNLNLVIKIISGFVVIFVVLLLFYKSPNPLQSIFLDKGQNLFKVSNQETSTPVVTNNQIVKENIQQNNFSFSHKLISPEQYRQKLESGEYIHIDIRTPQEYTSERIVDGLNIDFYSSDFKERLNSLDKTKKYLYHCQSGHRSGLATDIFKELGFKQVYELDGGLNAWKQAGLETKS